MEKKTWRKISFRELASSVKQEAKILYAAKVFRFLPVFVIYSVTVILLLKLSQVVLGW